VKKKTLPKRILFFLATRYGHMLARLVCRWARVSIVNAEPVRELEKKGEPVLYALWHGRMLCPVWWHRGTGLVAMVSQHEDGEMVSQLVAHMGYKTIRGSSTRGGSAAARHMVAAIRKGTVAAMICDGPRGPARTMKIGTPWIAAVSGAWTIPITWAGNRVWTFNSWDAFQVPKPFSKALILIGEPIPPIEKNNEAIETFRLSLEQTMNQLVEQAEAQVKENRRDTR
jgi:lysophospholipid acyltransferase (LPLAT)-like uncharacterized protein